MDTDKTFPLAEVQIKEIPEKETQLKNVDDYTHSINMMSMTFQAFFNV